MKVIKDIADTIKDEENKHMAYLRTEQAGRVNHDRIEAMQQQMDNVNAFTFNQ